MFDKFLNTPERLEKTRLFRNNSENKIQLLYYQI